MNCEICNKKFETQDDLTEHCDQPNICVYCHGEETEIDGDRLKCIHCGNFVHKLHPIIQEQAYNKRYS